MPKKRDKERDKEHNKGPDVPPYVPPNAELVYCSVCHKPTNNYITEELLSGNYRYKCKACA